MMDMVQHGVPNHGAKNYRPLAISQLQGNIDMKRIRIAGVWRVHLMMRIPAQFGECESINYIP